MYRCISNTLLFLGFLCVSPLETRAEQIFQATLKGKALLCTVNEQGVINSGRMKKGSFKEDVSLKDLRKILKKLRKQGNVAAFSKSKKKIKVVKARVKACTEAYGSTPPSNQPTAVPPVDPTPTPESNDRSGNELSSEELFQCSGEEQPSKSRIKRIDSLEWATTLGLRGSDAEFNPLTADPNHQYTTFSEGETLNPIVLNEYFNYVPRAKTGWVIGSESSGVRRPPEHKCMIAVAPPDHSCITNFLKVYLKDFVLFRDPTPDELERLTAFAEDAVANGDRSTDAGRSGVMQQITSAAWLSSAALFRSEVGEGDMVAEGISRLSDSELGKAVAYALTDSGPGAPRIMQTARVFPALNRIQAIEDAITDGTISNPAKLDALVAANYAGVDEAREAHYSEFWMGEKLERFFMEWLELGGIPTSFHDTPSATADVSGLTNVDLSYNHMKKKAYYGHEIMLSEQAIEMISRIVESDQHVLETLLTSRQFYLPSNLDSSFGATDSPQAAYGVKVDVPATRQGRWNQLPANQRAGILTHPAWLAAHSDNFENGPSAVKRGKWIRTNLLCGMVPDTPITVDASFPPSTASLSARERLNLATGDRYCQSCHQLMNPLGLPFEIYNHAGFLRASDHGNAPNGSSNLVFTGDPSLDGSVQDAVQLSEKLASSPVVKQCFVRQVFRFFMGRKEKIADACTLVAMQNSYDQSGGSLKNMLQTLIKSPTFTMRQTGSEEEE